MLKDLNLTIQEDIFLSKVILDIRNHHKIIKAIKTDEEIKSSTVFFDCDDTLIMHPRNKQQEKKSKLKIKSSQHGLLFRVKPHLKHIEKLKQHKKNGSIIVVWSGGGQMWAKDVIKALGLEKYVDICLDKPFLFYDDLDSHNWMGERIYYDSE